MIQTIDFAPLDGITKVVFRQVWSRYFGGVDRYFIPFFSPTPHHTMTPRDLREVDFAHNANLPSVPQVMTKNAGLHRGQPESGLPLRHRHRQGQRLRLSGPS